MNAERKAARQRLGDMPTKAEYLELMDRAKLTPLERKVCDMKYIDGQNHSFIGDSLGYSEDGIKRIHQRVLRKLARII